MKRARIRLKTDWVYLKASKAGVPGGVDVMVSVQDYPFLSQFRWFIANGYVKTNTLVDGEGLMHIIVKRVLEGVEVPPGYIVDHVDGNKLDIRRQKLEVITRKQNAQNKSKRDNTASKFFGVTKDRYGRFVASITIDGTYVYLGTYKIEADAARARDTYLVQRPDYDNLRYKLNYPLEIDYSRSLPPYTTPPRTSKYTGVFYHKQSGKYEVKLCHKGKCYLNKRFKHEDDAARAYDHCVVSMQLDRPLNFEHEHPHYNPPKQVRTNCIQTDNADVLLLITTTPNARVLIDIDDYDRVKHFTVSVTLDGYVIITGKQLHIGLHRYLLDVTDPIIFVDHINGNPCDNRKSNLRATDTQGNSDNRTKRNKKTNSYGVNERKAHGNYIVKFTYKRKHTTKVLATLEEATRYYDLMCTKYAPNSLKPLNHTWTPEEVAEWTAKLPLLETTEERKEKKRQRIE